MTPASAAQWAAARRLIEDYARSLAIDLSFQDFDHELASLEIEYGPPDGAFLLAEQSGAYVGCGGFRRWSDERCEMKRLYVDPAAREGGLGRALAAQLIAEARGRGYRFMRLDTLPTMSAARHVYAALGFREIAPYRYNPIVGTTFLELAL